MRILREIPANYLVCHFILHMMSHFTSLRTECITLIFLFHFVFASSFVNFCFQYNNYALVNPVKKVPNKK